MAKQGRPGPRGGKVTKQWSDAPEAVALRELLDDAGGQYALARLLEKPYSTIHNWAARGRVGQDGARLVEQKIPGWTKERIRPDLKPGEWTR